MSSITDLSVQAASLLPRINRWCDVDLANRAELLAQGVPKATVRNLYPFNLDAYLMCAADLLREPDAFYNLSAFFTKAADAAYASAGGAVHDSLSQTLAASAYARIAATLPLKSSSPATRRTPPVVFRQWTYTLLYLNALVGQISAPVPFYSIQARQLSAIRGSVMAADHYFKQRLAEHHAPADTASLPA